MALTRDAILTAVDLKTETVSVPEWGGDVNIKSLTSGQMDDIGAKVRTDDYKDSFGYLLLSAAIVDDAGAPIFSAEDIEALKKKSRAPIIRCINVANRLCGITSQEDAKNPSGTTPA